VAHRIPVLLCLIALLGPAFAHAGPFAATGVDQSVPTKWGSSVVDLVRGPKVLGDPNNSDPVTFGTAANAIGAADAVADFSKVVSIGDGGSITVQFNRKIVGGAGSDFAVFSNGFEFLGGVYGELAYVEVSSNGIDFARFDSTSLTPGAIGGFGVIDPTDIGNLAGQFISGQGSELDLSDLAGHALVTGGLLDLFDVHFVRLIDVVGDGSTVDASLSPIHDPFPTAFESGGFDLDAIGILNVPEPGAAPLLALGMLGLVVSRRLLRAERL
jgi:hypothetical protein